MKPNQKVQLGPFEKSQVKFDLAHFEKRKVSASNLNQEQVQKSTRMMFKLNEKLQYQPLKRPVTQRKFLYNNIRDQSTLLNQKSKLVAIQKPYEDTEIMQDIQEESNTIDLNQTKNQVNESTQSSMFLRKSTVLMSKFKGPGALLASKSEFNQDQSDSVQVLSAESHQQISVEHSILMPYQPKTQFQTEQQLIQTSDSNSSSYYFPPSPVKNSSPKCFQLNTPLNENLKKKVVSSRNNVLSNIKSFQFKSLDSLGFAAIKKQYNQKSLVLAVDKPMTPKAKFSGKVTSPQFQMLGDFLTEKKHSYIKPQKTSTFLFANRQQSNQRSQRLSPRLVFCSSNKVSRSDLQDNSTQFIKTISKFTKQTQLKTASHCSCAKQNYQNRFNLCQNAIQWLALIENKTDTPINYNQSQDIFHKVLNKEAADDSEIKQIQLDVDRTFPNQPYFQSAQGSLALERLLTAVSKHSSSAGYTQGMNYFAGAILFHSDEIIAFELIIRALNDFHFKEVHMIRLPGLYVHCEILHHLIQNNLPELGKHLQEQNVTTIQYCPAWVMSLMTQLIPLQVVQDFLTLFWEHEWISFYRCVLTIMQQLQPQLLQCKTSLQIQLAIQMSFALIKQDGSNDTEQEWHQILKSVRDGSFNNVNNAEVKLIRRQYGIN